MQWPQLVPRSACVTPVLVSLTDGIGEDGEPLVVRAIETTCNYSEQQKQVVDTQRRLVALSATLLFPGDIAPDVQRLEGYVSVDGDSPRNIFRASRARNPDGTVNYTQLELI